MTDNEKKTLVQSIINDPNVSANVILDYLALAKAKILSRAYPFQDFSQIDMPQQYDMIQCELASRYIFRRGAEGQKSSTENGVQRVYGTVNDEDLLSEVVQVVGVSAL